MKKFSKGQIIAFEGEKSCEIFVLLSGSVGIFKGRILVNEYNEKGIVLGEMSSLLCKERTASVIALEDSEILVLDANVDFLLEEKPEIVKKILVNLAEKLYQTTKDYWLLAKVKKPELFR